MAGQASTVLPQQEAAAATNVAYLSVYPVAGTQTATEVTMQAKLWDKTAGWTELDGETITFTVDGQSVTAVTGPDGVAEARVSRVAGEPVVASFAETAVHREVSASHDLANLGKAPADVVFTVDESGSMDWIKDALTSNLPFMAETLAADLDFQIGLMGFGANPSPPVILQPATNNLEHFKTAVEGLRINGSQEPGIDAVGEATKARVGLRSNAAECIVMITDEGTQSSQWTEAQAMQAMSDRGATLFSIVKSTLPSAATYRNMATNSGGQFFDIDAFQTNPQPVLDAMLTTCVAAVALRPDLAVEITDNKEWTTSESRETVVVTNRNDGLDTVDDITTEVRLYAPLSVVSVSHGGTARLATDGGIKVTWPLYELDSGESVQFEIQIAVDEGAGPPDQLRYVATIADDGANGPDLAPANNRAEDTTEVRNRPDLTVDVTDGAQRLHLSEDATAVVDISNAGLVDTTGTEVTLEVDGGVEITSASNGGTFTQSGGVWRVVWPAFNLAAGADTSREIELTVLDTAAVDSIITYTARVTDDGSHGVELTPANNRATDTTEVFGEPDLAVTVTDGIDQIRPGGTATATVNVENLGRVFASGTDLVVEIDGDIQVTSVSDGGTATAVTGGYRVVWPAFRLDRGQTTTRTIELAATPTARVDSIITYTATVTDDGAHGVDLNQANNRSVDTTEVFDQPDLSVTVSDGIDQIRPRGTATATVTVENLGRVFTSGTDLVVEIDGDIQVTSVSDGGTATAVPGGYRVTWPAFRLDLGASTTKRIDLAAIPTARVDSIITYTATVTDDGAHGVDLNQANNRSVDTTEVFDQPDLAVTVTDGIDQIRPEGTATATVTVTNLGRVDTTGTLLTVTIAGDVENIVATDGGQVRSVPGGWFEVTWPVFRLPLGDTITRQIQLAATPNARVDTTISYTATVGDDGAHGADLNPANNTSIDTTGIFDQPDLAVTVTDGIDQIRPGSAATATVNVSNVGRVYTSGTDLVVAVDGEVEITSVSDGGTSRPVPGGHEVVWPAFRLDLGEATTRQFEVRADPRAMVDSIITYTATVTDDGTHGQDLNPANNTSIDTTEVFDQPDLAVTVSDGIDEIRPQATATATVNVSNVGRVYTSGTALTVTVMGDVEITSVSDAGRATPITGGYQVTWPAFRLDRDESTTRQIELATIVTARVDSFITYTASVTDDGAHGQDLDPANNESSDTTQILDQPDLTVTVSDGIDQIRPEGTATATVTVHNAGRVDTYGTAISVIVQGDVTITSVSDGGTFAPAPNGGHRVTWPEIQLPLGHIITRQIEVEAIPAARVDSTITYTANVTDDGAHGPDLTPANNQAVDTTEVFDQPDLTVTVSDGIDQIRPEGTATATVTVNNEGRVAATGTALSVTIDGAVTVTSVSDGGTATPIAGGYEVTWPAFDMDLRQSVTRQILVAAPATAPVDSIITYTANVTEDGSHGADLTPENNRSVDTTEVFDQPDLTITVSDGIDQIRPEQAATATVSISNVGRVATTGTAVTVTVAGDVVITGISDGGTTRRVPGGWQEVSWPAFRLEIGQTTVRTISLSATRAARVDSTVTYTATVGDDGAHGGDLNPDNNLSVDTTEVFDQPDLAITVSDGIEEIRPDQQLTATVRVNNRGRVATTGTTVTLKITGDVEIKSISDGGTSRAISGGFEVTWPVFDLAIAGEVARYVDLHTKGDAKIDSNINYTANVTEDGAHGDDLVPANNEATDKTLVFDQPDLVVKIDDGMDVIRPGQPAVATVTVTNEGRVDAQGSALTVTVTGPLQVVSVSHGGTFVALPNGGYEVTWPPFDLPIGESLERQIGVVVSETAQAGEAIEFVATVKDDGVHGADLTPANNRSENPTVLVRDPDPVITPQAAPPTPPTPTPEPPLKVELAKTGAQGVMALTVTACGLLVLGLVLALGRRRRRERG
ncbi:MAG: DUF11 domain-containing protein [Bifidobacteriaceae bacterium]|nr:DUF11 domain-containing protein [Bifidobacteriaceae bacterium]